MGQSKRDLILKTLDHKEPKEIPIDLAGGPTTGITGGAYSRLLDYLDLSEKIRIYDAMQWLAAPSGDVLDWANVSCLDPFLSGGRTLPEESYSERWKEWSKPEPRSEEKDYLIPKDVDIETDSDGNEYISNDEGEIMLKRSPSSFYFDDFPVEYHPLKDVDDIDNIEKLPQSPVARDWSESDFELLERNVKWFYENTDYALMVWFGGSFFENSTHLRGYENFLIDLKKNPDYVRGLQEMLVEKYKRELDDFLDAVKDYVQIIAIADDLGHQTSQLLSPEDYRELLHPYAKEVYQYIKKNSDCYLFRHCCGAIKPFIEDFIEMGIDILNPVQISAKGMEPSELKEEFGEELTFWGGGCDTQDILPNASPEKVKKHVKEMCKTFAPGGGFVFNQVHNIQPGVPPENIEAMYEGVREVQREIY